MPKVSIPLQRPAPAPREGPYYPGDEKLVRPEDGPDSPQWGQLFGRARITNGRYPSGAIAFESAAVLSDDELAALFGVAVTLEPEGLPAIEMVCAACGATFTRTETVGTGLVRPEACASCWFRKKGTKR